MVLYVVKYVIHPDKMEAFSKWAEGAVKRTLTTPGLVEYRAYRPVTGPSQVVSTYEFADMAAWAAWQGTEVMQTLNAELHTFTLDVTAELWGPSPVVPAPLRPKR